MSIIGIIPARKGSKGIKDKNIIPFCGKPLIYWTIHQALNSKIEKLYISTDSDQIAEIGSKYSIEIAIRPPRIAQDRSSTEEAILYTINDKKLKNDDIIVLLQCTSPLRLSYDIDNCINMKLIGNDSIFSMSLLKDSTIWTMRNKRLQGALFDPDKRNVMRQDRPDYFYENGSIYVFTVKGIKESGLRLHGNIGMYQMFPYQSFEIDEPDDIELCKYYFKRKILW